MENNIEEFMVHARKMIQDVMMLVWFKQGLILEKPSPELSFTPETSHEFLDNVCNLVWIESYKNELKWKDFLIAHFKRMTTTPYLFANYVAYACYLLHTSSCTRYESSFYTLSLVNHFVLHCWQEERKEFINTCVELFCAFFEKEISPKFDVQGDWRNFNHYLEKEKFFTTYKHLMRANRSIHDIFNEFQDLHLESTEPQDINGVVLKDITEIEVETHQKAVDFAESIAAKMKELCMMTFEEVLRDFAKTDRQVEELYRQKVGEASGGIPIEDQVSSEDNKKEALENIQNKTNSKKNDKKKKAKASDISEDMDLDLDISKSQDLHPTAAESNRIPKLAKAVEEYRQMVGEASSGIPIEDQVSSENNKKEALENIQNKTNSKKNDKKKKTKASDISEDMDLDMDISKSQDLRPTASESNRIPKLAKAVEEYRQMVGEASGGIPIEDPVASKDFKKEAPGNIQSKTNSKRNGKSKNVKASDSLDIMDSGILKPPAIGPEAPESDLIPKLTKAKRVQNLLKEMLEDVTKMSELIKFLYYENGTGAPNTSGNE